MERQQRGLTEKAAKERAGNTTEQADSSKANGKEFEKKKKPTTDKERKERKQKEKHVEKKKNKKERTGFEAPTDSDSWLGNG